MVSGTLYERKLADKLENFGFHVERVASSGGRRNSVCDLVGIKEGKVFLIEVKSRRGGVFYANHLMNDFERLIETSERCGAIPLLAILFKRKGWKFIELEKNNIPSKVSFTNGDKNLKFYNFLG